MNSNPSYAKPTSPDCGTYAGVQRHTREGTRSCRDCQDANNNYTRSWRIDKLIGNSAWFPRAVRPELLDMDGLGATIARSMREAA